MLALLVLTAQSSKPLRAADPDSHQDTSSDGDPLHGAVGLVGVVVEQPQAEAQPVEVQQGVPLP